MEKLENSFDVAINPESEELLIQLSGLLFQSLRGICPNCGNPMSTSRCDTCS